MMVMKKDDLVDAGSAFVENMTEHYSVFHHSPTGAKFAFERHGVVGSVVEVPERVLKDPYFQRAIKRGKLRVLKSDEAEEVMASLVLPDRARVSSIDLLQQALEEGASEKSGSRYVRDDLPESGREVGEISQEEVWEAHRTEHGIGEPKRVKPAGVPDLQESPTDIGGPLPPEQVLTSPVKQGEWTSDTGLEG
jgi:hypothetical protein